MFCGFGRSTVWLSCRQTPLPKDDAPMKKKNDEQNILSQKFGFVLTCPNGVQNVMVGGF